jgi:hypothetical protein
VAVHIEERQVDERAQRFTKEIAEMRIEDPSPGRHGLWARVGLVAMLVGVGVALLGFTRSLDAIDAFAQRDAMALGLLGIATTIAGAAIYIRYATTKVLRFWLARLTFELHAGDEARGGQR